MKRFNKTNGMYALLVAVATMIGITIYGSCSADEDYGDYSSRDELFTLADEEMNLRNEGNGTVMFHGFYIDSVGTAIYNHVEFLEGYHANLTIQWSNGWAGNMDNPQCQISAQVSSVHNADTECETTSIIYDEFSYTYIMYNIQCTPFCEWKPDDKLHIYLQFTGWIRRSTSSGDIYWGTKTFELELTYNRLLELALVNGQNNG